MIRRINNNPIILGSQTIGLNIFKDHFIILIPFPEGNQIINHIAAPLGCTALCHSLSG